MPGDDLSLRTWGLIYGGAVVAWLAVLGALYFVQSGEVGEITEANKALEARRDELSGVNVDEELVRMIDQEQAYAAASQYLRVVSDLQNELLNIVTIFLALGVGGDSSEGRLTTWSAGAGVAERPDSPLGSTFHASKSTARKGLCASCTS